MMPVTPLWRGRSTCRQAHEICQCVVADLHEVIGCSNADPLPVFLGDELDLFAYRSLLYIGEEFFDDVEFNVGLEQAHAHIAKGCIDDLFAQFAVPSEPFSCGSKPLGDGLEHGGSS